MKKLFFALILTALATPGYSLLAPLYQSAKELQAVLASRDLFDNLKTGESIVEIKHVDESYVIQTESREMVVDVIYLPATQVGPIEFKLNFHAPTERHD